MTEVLYKNDNVFFKAEADHKNSNVTIESNMGSLQLFKGPLEYVDVVKGEWNFFCLAGAIYMAHHSGIEAGKFNNIKMSLSGDNESSYSIGITNINSLSLNLGNNSSEVRLYDKISNRYKKMPEVKSIRIMSGRGRNRITKSISFLKGKLKGSKDRFDRHRYCFFGGAGDDEFYMDAYGINFLSGGVGNDFYNLNFHDSYPSPTCIIENSYDAVSQNFKSAKSFSTYASQMKQFIDINYEYMISEKPQWTSRQSISFINDFGKEKNQLEVNMAPNSIGGHYITPKVYIASSKQLGRKLASKLSPTPFYIIRVSKNYILLHPQSVRSVCFSFFGSKYLNFTSKSGQPTFSEDLNKLYSFNKLPDNFNYRKLKAQLNGVMYKRVSSLERKGIQYFLSESLK